MALIRSKNTKLTSENDEQLTSYLWPIIKEMIKTVIENKQNLIIEGGYIPFDWKKDFTEKYLKEITYYCLVMTAKYIKEHFLEIKKYANIIEERVDDSNCILGSLIEENEYNLRMCKNYNCKYILIDDSYKINI